ncbi:MAG: isochorismatase family protein [Janthinobacterium lividum]
MVTALDKNTALVLIDLQNGILQMPVVGSVSEILANAAKLVAAFRQAELPIVLVTVDPTKNPSGLRNEAKRPPIGTLPASWFELAPEIKAEPGDIRITKYTWGAFHNTDNSLDEELKKRHVTGIVLAGVSTSIGVESTARAAFERGYNIAFAQDAMSDLVPSAEKNSLQVIFPRIGELDSTDNIIKVLSAL